MCPCVRICTGISQRLAGLVAAALEDSCECVGAAELYDSHAAGIGGTGGGVGEKGLPDDKRKGCGLRAMSPDGLA